MRIALAACLVLGCTLCGKAAADAARRRVRALDALGASLRTLRIHMTGMLEPVRCALDQAENPILSQVSRGMDGGRSADAAWQAVRPAVLKRGGPGDALSEADVRVLDGLFHALGQSGIEEQEALLGRACESIVRLRDSAWEKAGEADRLYVSLGLLVGLLLALIVV